MKKWIAEQTASSVVIPFREKTSGPALATVTPTKPDSFEALGTKLRERIGQIESKLAESMSELEDDVKRLARDKQNIKDIDVEIRELSNLIEQRITRSVEALAKNSRSQNDDKEQKFTLDITSQLVKLLSADFYKSVLTRLKKEDTKNEVDEFGMDAVLVQKIKPIFDFLYYKYWRVETTGIENIPDTGRALIVANHSGTLPYDGAMLAAAILNEHPTRKDARYLVENFVYHMPILGTFMYRIGGVRACPENAERLLSKEHLVIVFPEGVKGIGKYYNQRYQLQRFGRGGFIKLCLKTKSPLIPVGIVGAEEIHPILYKSNVLAKMIGLPYIPITPTFPLMGMLGMIPFPTKWRIHFGKAVTFNNLPNDAIEDEILIHELSEKVRADIQKILIELLKQRENIWG